MVSGCGLPPAHTLRPRGAGLPSCPARGLVPCRPPLPGSPSLVLGDPLESLFTDHLVDCIHLRVVLRIAVFLAELADVVGETWKFSTVEAKAQTSHITM